MVERPGLRLCGLRRRGRAQARLIMTCPYCGNREDRVLDSRASREGLAIRRRRECLACGRRFTTYEQIEEIRPTVVKRDGRREPFTRDKVLRGLYLACRKRPVSAEDVESAADEIEAEVSGLSREVESSQIGEMVMKRLRDLDEVAYVRFASVYRQFKDATEFLRFVSELETEGGSETDFGGGGRERRKGFRNGGKHSRPLSFSLERFCGKRPSKGCSDRTNASEQT